MNTLALAIVLVTFSAVSASYGAGVALVGPPSKGAFLKGPAASATLVGPDGSSISAAADAGAVAAPGKPGGVVTAAIEPGYIAPGPVIAPVIAPVVAPVAAPIVKTGTLVAGPSGTIKTSGPAAGLIAAPILAEPAIAAAPLPYPALRYAGVLPGAPLYGGLGYGYGKYY